MEKLSTQKSVEFHEKIIHEHTQMASMENEQYLRSMILSMKSDLTKLKDTVELVKKDLDTDKNLFRFDTDNIVDEVPDNPNMSLFVSMLKKHGSAIRFLANRLAPGSDDKIFKIQEASAQLSYLEDLKIEMKEMLTKQESSKTLSTKELELIQEIYALMDTKIGKQELGKKVDKGELQRIYRMLKKRIDDIATDVKKFEYPSAREDPFFSKKRLDVECASCGQYLSDKSDPNKNYES